ncbi:hypothetical protein CLAFUW4_07708 [Fulvia fulva]|uniref:Uncharacterized protein n=1 Tax=Passalora fulva TaxID=5499 RepID=A0A9Q8LDU5_PASFU|nr:uncharacterized protein CLAFUR5_07836 [Fulvia fulva]KAK4628754.1 hypothetical protein CLAFUR4_07713 [Fulvia fulva]KAK4630734.1 hypothetical protein CLAFUR0_07711 [Fulvia fulva]UJO15550.1 hypothetical protein CLAFUR5_07836 [Fulvia fulva]WPV13087.1 hypothetical protein CLAFUW4_07708 [Fulvia fulva]WPV27269.1 hypothetical protein CLAFUW7_07709 [Fulvia fulva]
MEEKRGRSRKSTDAAPPDVRLHEDYYNEGGMETHATREEVAFESTANEAADAFGGIPEGTVAAKGAIKKPKHLDRDAQLDLPWVQELVEKIQRGLRNRRQTKFSADFFYDHLQPAIKTACHHSCRQVRKDRLDGGSQYADGKHFHEKVRTPGTMVWGPAAQPLRNKNTPITAESRVPAPSGTTRRYIRNSLSTLVCMWL